MLRRQGGSSASYFDVLRIASTVSKSPLATVRLVTVVFPLAGRGMQKREAPAKQGRDRCGKQGPDRAQQKQRCEVVNRRSTEGDEARPSA